MPVAVSFGSCGRSLHGVLHLPPGASATSTVPGVVVANGFCVTRPMAVDDYAAALAAGGVASLAFDHAGFGASDAEPSRLFDHWLQARALRDALEVLARRPEVDARRLGLWAESAGAGQAFVVAALDRRVRALVGVVPAFLLEARAALPSATPQRLATGLATADERLRAPIGGILRVVSADQASAPSVLTPLTAHRWFTDLGSRPGSGWTNEVRFAEAAGPCAFDPLAVADVVEAAVLLQVAPDDEIPAADPAASRRAFEALPGPRAWADIAGGHFGAGYVPGEVFDDVVERSLAFLGRHL